MKRWKSCILYSIFKVFLLHLHFILGLKKSCFWSKNEYFLKIQNAIVFIQKGPFGVRIRSIHFMLLDKRHLFAVGCLSVTSNVSLTLLYKFYMTFYKKVAWLSMSSLRFVMLLSLYLRSTVHVFALVVMHFMATADKVFVWSLLLEL